jgi:hypothetical protein
MIEALYDAAPEINEAGNFQRKQFEQAKYNGCEIIP